MSLLRDYVGRPSPLYFARRMSERYGCQLYLKREDLNHTGAHKINNLYFARRMSERYGCQLYLKREDLNHTGAHKINNTIGQILLAKKMGKKRIIAETGAGQHRLCTDGHALCGISRSIGCRTPACQCGKNEDAGC